jgi:hypothetical protein
MDISILKQCMFMAQNDKVEKTLRNKRIYVSRTNLCVKEKISV